MRQATHHLTRSCDSCTATLPTPSQRNGLPPASTNKPGAAAHADDAIDTIAVAANAIAAAAVGVATLTCW